MVAPPQSLAHPRILARVLWGALRRAGRAQPADPAHAGGSALSPEAMAALRARPAARYAGSYHRDVAMVEV